MFDRTDHLIRQLAANASPVRRLLPPAARACLWLAAAVTVTGLLVYLLADSAVFLRRAADTQLAIELAATLMTGIAAAFAAFELSLPDRSPRWLLLPLPPLVLWIAASGYGCYRNWLSFGPSGWTIGESANCFLFILGAGVPLGITLLLLLRRAAPLAPLPVAAAGGLSVAATAAFTLQFFHPFDVTFMDLAVHLIAVAIVVFAAMGAERLVGRALNNPPIRPASHELTAE